jgi:selenide, water dikinase
LTQVLGPLKNVFADVQSDNLLVGLGDPDDAAIWKIDDDKAIVVTTDYFTPVVDTPFEYGAIAAANSLSDIYAMGGKPFLALNIANLPNDLPPEIGGEILRGGAEKAKEAGVIIAGGHTVQDEEPKYGLVVLGFVDPNKYITKTGAQAGDVLILTKPLGFGVTATAIKNQKAQTKDIEAVIEWMSMLNRDASEISVEVGVRGGTDVTGFSLLGHAYEMASASNVDLVFDYKSIPILAGAKKYAKMGMFPGGATDNHSYYSPHVTFNIDLETSEKMLLYDPQTSGGLLLSVSKDKLSAWEGKARLRSLAYSVVGLVENGTGKITIN